VTITPRPILALSATGTAGGRFPGTTGAHQEILRHRRRGDRRLRHAGTGSTRMPFPGLRARGARTRGRRRALAGDRGSSAACRRARGARVEPRAARPAIPGVSHRREVDGTPTRDRRATTRRGPADAAEFRLRSSMRSGARAPPDRETALFDVDARNRSIGARAIDRRPARASGVAPVTGSTTRYADHGAPSPGDLSAFARVLGGLSALSSPSSRGWMRSARSRRRWRHHRFAESSARSASAAARGVRALAYFHGRGTRWCSAVHRVGKSTLMGRAMLEVSRGRTRSWWDASSVPRPNRAANDRSLRACAADRPAYRHRLPPSLGGFTELLDARAVSRPWRAERGRCSLVDALDQPEATPGSTPRWIPPGFQG
jgi:hypothetical protein